MPGARLNRVARFSAAYTDVCHMLDTSPHFFLYSLVGSAIPLAGKSKGGKQDEAFSGTFPLSRQNTFGFFKLGPLQFCV